jgi:hypothetical protein
MELGWIRRMGLDESRVVGKMYGELKDHSIVFESGAYP